MDTKYFSGHDSGIPSESCSKPLVSMLDGSLSMYLSFEIVDLSNWVNRIILSRLLPRLSGHHPILSLGCLARIHPILCLFALGAFEVKKDLENHRVNS